MPYMQRAKWGAVDSLRKQSLVMDPHMFTASVALVKGAEDADGRQETLFWRSKTRCTSYAEWMQLHDASDGTVLWRAEARYSDRAAPVEHTEPSGRTRTEFLTVVRLYLEGERQPRLMIVHRDTNPAGIRVGGGSHTLAVYTLEQAEDEEGPGGAGRSGVGQTREQVLDGSQPVDEFDFAALPEGEDVFTLNFNPTLTTLSLTSMHLPAGVGMRSPRAAPLSRGVRTLARLKRDSEHVPRTIDVDAGLDVPLVAMLLASVDQLLLSHDAIDYDVAWPVDYGFPRGECFSPRKQQADGMKIVATAETNTGDAPSSSSRSCFPFCLEPR